MSETSNTGHHLIGTKVFDRDGCWDSLIVEQVVFIEDTDPDDETANVTVIVTTNGHDWQPNELVDENGDALIL